MSELENIMAKLEPEAITKITMGDKCMLLSIAISLKRIADAVNTTNAYGESGSEALANSISRGLREFVNNG